MQSCQVQPQRSLLEPRKVNMAKTTFPYSPGLRTKGNFSPSQSRSLTHMLVNRGQRSSCSRVLDGTSHLTLAMQTGGFLPSHGPLLDLVQALPDGNVECHPSPTADKKGQNSSSNTKPSPAVELLALSDMPPRCENPSHSRQVSMPPTR